MIASILNAEFFFRSKPIQFFCGSDEEMSHPTTDLDNFFREGDDKGVIALSWIFPAVDGRAFFF